MSDQDGGGLTLNIKAYSAAAAAQDTGPKPKKTFQDRKTRMGKKRKKPHSDLPREQNGRPKVAKTTEGKTSQKPVKFHVFKQALPNFKKKIEVGQVSNNERNTVLKVPKTENKRLFRETSSFELIEPPLHPKILTALKSKLNYDKPTRIQWLSIPPILQGRDVLLKSDTGSGKTCAFLIPIVQRLQAVSPRITRKDGCKAIVISPTRELAMQIDSVLKIFLSQFHWIVHTIIMGGEKKKSEKARLRKGVTIVVATPGRLLDHLNTTQAFLVEDLQYLVLDEADRLLDLGFERALSEIVSILDSRAGAAAAGPGAAVGSSSSGIRQTFGNGRANANRRNIVASASTGFHRLRQTVLASATLSSDSLKQLTSLVLCDPVLVGFDKSSSSSKGRSDGTDDSEKRSAWIEQQYIKVESRHRLVVLASYLRLRVNREARKTDHPNKSSFKALVFLSTCASVDFHYKLLKNGFWPPRPYSHSSKNSEKDDEPEAEDGYSPRHQPEEDSDKDLESENEGRAESEEEGEGPDPERLINTNIWKLHGSMPQQARTASFLEFGRASGGILFCTDVAARGLDLPEVDCIVQVDPPEEIQDYIHRVGRTGRMGEKGDAIIFLLPSEEPYLDILRSNRIGPQPLALAAAFSQLNLPKGFFPPNARPRHPGFLLQRQFEGLVAGDESLTALAGAGFQAYVRSYATYPKEVKSIFHPKQLQLGHVARSFALTTAPSKIQSILSHKNPMGKQKNSKKGWKGASRDKSKKPKGRPRVTSGSGTGITTSSGPVSEFF